MLETIKKYTRDYLISLTSIEKIQKNPHKLPLSLESEKIHTPEILEMSLHEQSCHLKKSYYVTPNVYGINLKKIIYCPTSHLLFTPSKRIIIDSSSTARSRDKIVNFVNLRKLYFMNPETVEGHCTVFRTVANGDNYYHTLIDNIPRLYTLDQSSYQKFQEIKVLYGSELTEVESFFLKKVLPKNVRIIQVDPSKLYLVNDFIFLRYLSRRFVGFLPSTYLNWFLEKVQPKRLREKKNRIFISRKKSSHKYARCILNEDEVFSVLKKYGFKKYQLEDLSIEDQVNLFYDAEFVVGAHGAGLTNVIFSEKIKVLEFHPMKSILPAYYYLSKSRGHCYLYWTAQELDRDSNFEVNTIEMEKIIKANLSR